MTEAAPAPLAPGFDDGVMDATRCFRTILTAMARPAGILDLPVRPPAPAGLNAGVAAVLLTLADADTPVWLGPGVETPEARDHLRFHAGCPLVDDPARAVFAVLPADGDLAPLDALSLGTAEYPDRSATVVLKADGLSDTAGPWFSGPGILVRRRLAVIPAAADLWPRIRANGRDFPRGLDWIFATPESVAALPRTAKVED